MPARSAGALLPVVLLVGLTSCSQQEQADAEAVVEGASTTASPSGPPEPHTGANRRTGRRTVRSPSPEASPTASAAPATAPAATSAGPPGRPLRIRIPSIGVDGPVGLLGLEPDGALEVPEDPWDAGWWQGGSEPGEDGPAVIVAHRDSAQGPALFYRVPQLAAGDQVIVEVAGGGRQVFVVDRVELHDKDRFPTMAVYGSTPNPTLRLLTCGGDYGADGYQGNYVVFAHQVA